MRLIFVIKDISQCEWQGAAQTMFRDKMGPEGADGKTVPGNVIEVKTSSKGFLR